MNKSVGKSVVRVDAYEKATGRAKIILACILGCVVTLQLGAFSVVLETTVSGISDVISSPQRMR